MPWLPLPAFPGRTSAPRRCCRLWAGGAWAHCERCAAPAVRKRRRTLRRAVFLSGVSSDACLFLDILRFRLILVMLRATGCLVADACCPRTCQETVRGIFRAVAGAAQTAAGSEPAEQPRAAKTVRRSARRVLKILQVRPIQPNLPPPPPQSMVTRLEG